jgi:hypothetical protein
MRKYIHNDPEFEELILIVADKLKIDPYLIEKDYWIMHTLYGLNVQGIEFELKGGTSLSKGYGIIDRFSEDIDIHIKTNFGLQIEGKEDDEKVRNDRKAFYDKLKDEIKIDGIIGAERDINFDDVKFRSGGIRLNYKSISPKIEGVKEGILLEAGFDQVAPNKPVSISSWILDHVKKIEGEFNYIDNTAKGVLCYLPEYTFVKKVQTIISKHRKEIQKLKAGSTDDQVNFMRQYYDVYCLLNNKSVIEFIGSEKYKEHKKKRIKGADATIDLKNHPALTLEDENIFNSFKERYQKSSNLYYKGQPDFDDIMARIRAHIHLL